MRAIELINRPGVTVHPDTTIIQAAERMEQAGVGCLAIVDSGSLVGVVTDRDLVRRAMARRLPADVRVDSVMTAPVISIQADADARSAFELFRTHAVRRVAVMRDREFLGMITVDDLLVVLSRELADIVRPVTAELLFAHHDSQVPVATAGSSQ